MAKIGSQNVTADAVVGVSGRPCRVYSMDVLSGGTAAVVILRNGTAATATAFAQHDGTISKGTHTDWPKGLFFPAGCFCDIDANTTYATVGFENEF